ncbi:TetR/AcrR family transcriptional regulator [Convivina intestini]|uniref:TetR/AcrR family transcriptional regulator n=1 Tax=Convivina intestini TaxID=1505726 RepID=UPI00200E14FF|nr:TetR/AcrR family transcriptional regulator [Convivina intestini]CAH1851777.1 hypothetical protein R078131_00339 [Convivina intestini]
MSRNKYPEKTRDTIVKIAFQLFGNKGYENVVMQDIINESGFSRGAIYHHFKNKNEIMMAVLEKLQNEDSNLFTSILHQQLKAKEKLDILVDFIVTDKSRSELTKMMWSNKNHIVLFSNVTNTLNKAAPALSLIIKQGIQEGEFDTAYPDEAAEIIMLLLNIWMDPTLGIEKSHSKIERQFDFLILLLTNMHLSLFSGNSLIRLKKYYLSFAKTEG